MLPESVKTFGLKLISAGVRPPENILDRFIEFSILKDLLSQLAINCVLDVGANCGQFARHLRAVGYRGQIISFEPNAKEFLRLRHSFLNDPTWSGYQFALGEQDGRQALKIPELSVLGSFLDMGRDAKVSCEMVEVRRLDTLLTSIVKPSANVFMKMDTQGYDLQVFRGAQECLGMIRGLVSEISIQSTYICQPHYLETLTEYENAGFQLYHLSTVNRTSRGGLQEMNAYMTRS